MLAFVPVGPQRPLGVRRTPAGVVDEERSFQALVGHATELIVVWDAEGTIVYRNPAAIRFANGARIHAPRDRLVRLQLGCVAGHLPCRGEDDLLIGLQHPAGVQGDVAPAEFVMQPTSGVAVQVLGRGAATLVDRHAVKMALTRLL